MGENAEGDGPAALALQLMQFRAAPHDFIERVHEQFDVRDRILARTTTITFSPEAEQLAKGSVLVMDLSHPNRGSVTHTEILEGAAVRVSHQSHTAIVQAYIGHLYANLVIGSKALTPDNRFSNSAVASAIIDLHNQLITLPALEAARATSLFESLFGDDNQLKVFHSLSLPFELDDMSALCRFCKRLTDKYFHLVTVDVSSKGRKLVLRSIAPHRASLAPNIEADEGSSGSIPLRYLIFPNSPPSFRLHLPLAKRTDNYSFDIEAPHGQFFADASVLSIIGTVPPGDASPRGQGRKNGAGMDLVTQHAGHGYYGKDVFEMQPSTTDPSLQWSLEPKTPIYLTGFISGARTLRNPVYLGITHKELPGRSSLKMAIYTIFALAVIVFAIVAKLSWPIQAFQQFVTVLLALLTIVGVVSPYPRDHGPIGIPILSRTAPGGVLISSMLTLIWLHAPVPEWNNWSWLWNLLWTVPALAIVAFWAVRLGYRVLQLMAYYRAALYGATRGSGNY